MASQGKNTLLESRLVKASAENSLKAELRHLFVNLRLKGFHETDKSSLYADAAAACYDDSYLATGTFSENKGVLE
jgi:hypothetical protein